jgi:DNA-binding XRE family transcriptional regulator
LITVGLWRLFVKTASLLCQKSRNGIFDGLAYWFSMRQRSLSDPDYVELVTTLRRFRESAQLTQKDLAERLGKPQSFVAKFERCERRLDFLETLRVCRSLGVSVRAVVPESWRDLL